MHRRVDGPARSGGNRNGTEGNRNIQEKEAQQEHERARAECEPDGDNARSKALGPSPGGRKAQKESAHSRHRQRINQARYRTEFPFGISKVQRP
jgi:hypothetical protein